MKKEKIRILHLISSSGFLGAENVVLELAKQSKSAGHRPTIGVFKNQHNPNLELAEAATANGLNVQSFPCRGRFDKKTIRIVTDYLKSEHVQIVHSHNYKSNFYTKMALPANNVRWVATNHGRRTGSKLLIYYLLDLFTLRSADKAIAVSEKIAGQMKRAGINKKKVLVIDNGINLNRFMKTEPITPTRKSLGIKSGALVIGTVGSLTREKGHKYLIRAIPKMIGRFPETVFLFVGEGIERSNLENISCKLGIKDKVAFPGTRKDIPNILSTFNVFILPSLKEGLPMALLEAQAAKVPTIATRVGAIPNVIENGATGVLIPPKDSEAISRAIERILSDKKAASKMAERGFEMVRDNFSAESMANKYLSLYKKLL